MGLLQEEHIDNSVNNIIEFVKVSNEYSSYIQAKQDLKDVSKGGKHYYECSFMDISVRMDRLEDRKKELITYIGNLILSKIEKDSEIGN